MNVPTVYTLLQPKILGLASHSESAPSSLILGNSTRNGHKSRSLQSHWRFPDVPLMSPPTIFSSSPPSQTNSTQIIYLRKKRKENSTHPLDSLICSSSSINMAAGMFLLAPWWQFCIFRACLVTLRTLPHFCPTSVAFHIFCGGQIGCHTCGRSWLVTKSMTSEVSD